MPPPVDPAGGMIVRMARGRRPLPDEIKALKGNPGKRRLASLDKAKAKPAAKAKPRRSKGKAAPAKPPAATQIQVPDFLTGKREKALFMKVVDDYLQRRVARPPDLTAYARWAHYLDRWIICKETLQGKSTFFKSESKHGALLRRHPLFKDQLDIERVLQSLEDRLGLNPAARQNIIRGLASLPPALGDLFNDDPDAASDEPEAPTTEQIDAPPADSPLAFLQTAGKPH